MSFTPLLDHIYTFTSAVRVTLYFRTGSVGYGLQETSINITEIKFENQWYSYNAFVTMLTTVYGYTTEMAQTLIYGLTSLGYMFDSCMISDNTNSGKYNTITSLYNCNVKIGDTLTYGSNRYGGTSGTFTVRYIESSLLSTLYQKLNVWYTDRANTTYTYNLEFTPTRLYLYRKIENPIANTNSYTISYEKYKTINITNFGITDLGTYTDLSNSKVVTFDKRGYYTLPENLVACIPIGFYMSRVQTEVYMKVLPGSTSNVGGTYRFDEVNFGVSRRAALCTEQPALLGTLYSNLYTVRGYGLTTNKSHYGCPLRQNAFRETDEDYVISYDYDWYNVDVVDDIDFNSFINYNEDDDSYSVTFTHTHSLRLWQSTNSTPLPDNALICSVYAEDVLIDTFFASSGTKQYTYTFRSTGDKKSINVRVVYNANTTLPSINDSCIYTNSFNYTSQQYTLVHAIDTGSFAFKVENSNVYIGNTSRYAEGMVCVKGIAINTEREGYGIQVDNVLLFPDLTDKTRFSKALIVESLEAKGLDYDEAYSNLNNMLNSLEYEIHRLIIGYRGRVGIGGTTYEVLNCVVLHKHPQFYNGGTYEEFANTLT